MGLCFYFLVEMSKNPELQKMVGSYGMEPYIVVLLIVTVTLHVSSHVEYMVTDKSSGMKSLMISVGLQKDSYYLANFICFIVMVLPIILFVGITAGVYLFDGSGAPRFTIVIIFILFALHLSGIVFVVNSILKSPSLCSLLLVFSVLDLVFYHHLVMLVADGNSMPGLVLFVASADPYESIRLFGQSYANCKNNGTTIANGKDACVSTYALLIAMGFWTTIAYLFSIWFDEACPWQTDTAYRGLFFCFKSSESPVIQENDFELPQRKHNSKYFERSVSNREIGIGIKNVSREFSGKRVVDDINFNIYRGETTLLLGHNGAGKTTLMNMILGKLMPSHGHVRINGIRERGGDNSIGVCPQTSVYDTFLSVRQHMQLFSDLKSDLEPETRRRDIETTLHDVSLGVKADSLPDELSGGMRRKLSLGMAFVGKSSILILDEPSSGLDPDSRVFVWNAIRRYRADRTVLLSTQHMEEADYLGDRIAIMAEGKIICCGSSVFLTKIFGSGYKLRIECSETKRQMITDLAKKYFSKVKQSDNEHIVYTPGYEEGILDMVLELNDDSDKNLEDKLIGLLEYVEKHSEQLGIRSHGLRSSSIEDVLLNTSNLLHEEPKNSVKLSIDTSNLGQLKTVVNPPIQKETNLFMDQIHFLCAFTKKHIHSYRNEWMSILLYRVALVGFACWAIVDDINRLTYTPSAFMYLIIFHFVSYPVRENVSKFKIMQLNSQANIFVYWISQLLIDMLTIAVALAFVNVLLEVVLRENIVEGSRVSVHLIVSGGMILMGIASAFNCYVLSTFFSESKTATAYAILYFLIGLIVSDVLIPIIMLTLKIQSSLISVQRTFRMIFIIIYPTNAYQYMLHGLQVGKYVKPDLDPLLIPRVQDEESSPLRIGLVALVGQTVVFGLLLYLIEAFCLDPSSWVGRLWHSAWYLINRAPSGVIISEGQVDGDVLDERRKTRIGISNGEDTYRLVAHDLSKSYVPKVMVIDHLSFTVNKGECFGLLGVNGAGKSTCFSMLVGERLPDSGRIWLKGSYSDTNMHAYRRKLGYDPQESPSVSLSPVQALTFMARLRRVDEQSIPGLVNCLLLVLDMSEHANKSCNQLSGGTKRKLALGMSLIGNQEMLALDEPTAGVDPIARRGIWQLLRTLRSQKHVSIVISSHAMEECEAICDRISIMAKGKLRCIGTFLHLRNKFSQGCTVRIQCSTNENLTDFSSKIVPDLTSRLQRLAGYSVRLADVNINSATFNILTREFKRSALFRLLRDFNLAHKSLNYMVNDSSLEDIFLTMAREQQPTFGVSKSSSSSHNRNNKDQIV